MILHVVQSLDPAWGGIARVLPELAAELNAAGEPCRIATLCGDRFGRPPEVPGVEVLSFEANPGSRLGRSDAFRREAKALVGGADVIHLHGLWTAQNHAIGVAARRLGKPYIMTPHSMMMPWAWRRSWWKKRPIGWLFEHRNLRRAACLHALAEGEAEHMRALRFNDRIIVIPNGLRVRDYADLPSADDLIARRPEMRDRRWLLFLGRIHPQKGIVPMLRACFDLLAAAADWHLVIAGPDEVGMRPMLEAAIARKGLSDRVTFTGMLSRREVLACLGRATLLIQPSMSEGLSMSIIEGLAAGLPMLISTECNVPEVAHRGAGLVVPPTRGDIVKGLRQLITLDAAQLAEMGRRGRELAAERFDWGGLIPRYRRMYAEARAAAGPP